MTSIKKRSEKVNSKKCPVCYESDKILENICCGNNHLVCCTCINRLIDLSHTCPLCRAPFVGNYLNKIVDNYENNHIIDLNNSQIEYEEEKETDEDKLKKVPFIPFLDTKLFVNNEDCLRVICEYSGFFLKLTKKKKLYYNTFYNLNGKRLKKKEKLIINIPEVVCEAFGVKNKLQLISVERLDLELLFELLVEVGLITQSCVFDRWSPFGSIYITCWE